MGSLAGRVVIVTGGGGNLGGAVARLLEGRGARAVLPDRSVDVLAEGPLAREAAEAMARFGRLDGLVHTVGAYAGGRPVADEDVSTWTRLMDLNGRSTLLALKAVLPPMRRGGGGSIVTVASPDARAGRSGHGSYAAAKSAVVRLVEAAAEENVDAGVRVNCVLPTAMDTEANRRAGMQPDALVPPGDVAEVILFLLSDEARAVSGASVPVGFGRTNAGRRA